MAVGGKQATPLRALFGDFLAFGVRREGQGGIGRCRRLFSTPSRICTIQLVGRAAEPHAAAAGDVGVRRVGPARAGESEGEEEEVAFGR